MGYLGFLFNLTNLDLSSNIRLNDIVLDSEYLVIIISSSKVSGNHIVGFENFFNLSKSKFLYLTENFSFSKFIYLPETNFKYGKISLNLNKQLDFEFNMIWFSVFDYKQIYTNLFVSDLSVNFKERMELLLPFFK